MVPPLPASLLGRETDAALIAAALGSGLPSSSSLLGPLLATTEQSLLPGNVLQRLRPLRLPLAQPSLSLAPSRLAALAEHSRQEAIMKEAYNRGREEVLMALIQNGTIDASSIGAAAAAAAAIPEATTPAAVMPPSKDKNAVALETLGTSGIERRKKNAPYFDASTLEDPDPVTLANRRTRGGVTEPFPEKLHRMLKDVENNNETSIISFLPHGRAFAIHHVERFCREIMPRYFRQSRLSSFQRQLNLYGFTRISTGPDAGGYYHELFLKGRPALAIHMRRVGVPQPTEYRGLPMRNKMPNHNNPTASPDFYSMGPVRVSEHDTKPPPPPSRRDQEPH